MFLFQRVSLALVGIVCGVTVTAAQVSSDKEFRDWWAACDNLRNCSAYGFDSQLTGGGYIRIERGGAPAAQPKIAVVAYATEGVTFKLSFDDPALHGLPADAQTGEEVDASEMRRVVFSGDKAAPLIDSLRKAKEIVITRIDPPGRKSDTPISKISLNGAAAAMLWIDEQQKRLGTATALVRRGDKPDSSVPPQPKAPVVVPAKGLSGAAADKQPPKRDEAVIKEKGLAVCGEGDAGELDSATALSSDIWLYALRCPGSSGAYNFTYAFLIASAGQAKAARLVRFRWPTKIGGKQQDSGSDEFLINPDFSNVDMTMRSFSKGRGIGDCGDEESWMFDGKVFRLLEVKTMPHCRGVPSEDWPAVYRAERK